MTKNELTTALQVAKDLPGLAEALIPPKEEDAPEVTYKTYATPRRLDYMREAKKGGKHIERM